MVIRRPQREQTMGLVSDGCQNTGDCRCSHWRPFRSERQSLVAILTPGKSDNNVLSVTPTFGQRMPPCCQANGIVPTARESGLTNRIECNKSTGLRQRISRLVRKTLSFSKKLDNHIGAIWYFIHHYNAFLPV